MTAPPPLRIARGPGAAGEAIAYVRRFAEREALAEADTLAVIVEELVCNLVEHGCGDAGGDIELALWREAGGTHLRLCDGCDPFDPRDAPQPELPPERGGGGGLAIVRAWTRVLGYARADGRNRLDLLVPDERGGN
ncbi:MAG: ATP-binding protein [Sphingomonadaceae bacterium]|nr:ATP-binding protein [Sphingomonadaceae bacterium]